MLSASQLGRESELSDDQALRCTFCHGFVRYNGSMDTITEISSLEIIMRLKFWDNLE